MAKNEFLTKALYHLHYAKEYMGYCAQETAGRDKFIVLEWAQKIKSQFNQIRSALTQESQDLIQQEIIKGDPMSHAHVLENMLMMDQAQRNLLAMASDHILKNEFRIEKEETT